LTAVPYAPEQQQARHEEQREFGYLPWTHRGDDIRKRAPGQSRALRMRLTMLLLIFGLPGLWGMGTAPLAPPGLDLPQFLSRLRVSFYNSVESAAATEQTVAAIQAAFPSKRDSWPPVILAYYAALEGLRGKHASGLLNKLGHVNTAVSLMRRLPEDNPGSLEIRFLRFSLFRQLPLFFGVRPTVGPDLAVLIRMLEAGADPDVPREVRRDMVSYLIGCREADRAQIERLQQLGFVPAAEGEP
jgi:hypothetical protein